MQKIANYWGGYGIAPVTCIGGSDVYFAVPKGNGKLKEELDNAVASGIIDFE